MTRPTASLAIMAAVALTVTACGGDDTSATTLNDGADAVEVSPDGSPAADGEPGQDDPTDDATPGGESTGDQQDEPANEGAGEVIDPRTDHPVTAQPGRWAIGEAGFVEFDLDGTGGLVLVDVAEADGWSSRVDDESSDEIEVEFRRDNVKVDVEIQLDDGTLEVDIDTDIDPADPGVYELGQAGSMEYTVDGGLALSDVVVRDGWDLRMDDESSDEIEFRLTNGNERWRVEIELDDGKVELEIDYRVRDGR